MQHFVVFFFEKQRKKGSHSFQKKIQTLRNSFFWGKQTRHTRPYFVLTLFIVQTTFFRIITVRLTIQPLIQLTDLEKLGGRQIMYKPKFYIHHCHLEANRTLFETLFPSLFLGFQRRCRG